MYRHQTLSPPRIHGNWSTPASPARATPQPSPKNSVPVNFGITGALRVRESLQGGISARRQHARKILPFALRSLAPSSVIFDHLEDHRGATPNAPREPSAALSVDAELMATTGVSGDICVWEVRDVEKKHAELRGLLAPSAHGGVYTGSTSLQQQQMKIPTVSPIASLRFTGTGSASGASSLAWAPGYHAVARLAACSAAPGAQTVAVWDPCSLSDEPLLEWFRPSDRSDVGTHASRAHTVAWATQDTLLLGDGCGRVSLVDVRIGGTLQWTGHVGVAMRDAECVGAATAASLASRKIVITSSGGGGGGGGSSSSGGHLAAHAPPRSETLKPLQFTQTSAQLPTSTRLTDDIFIQQRTASMPPISSLSNLENVADIGAQNNASVQQQLTNGNGLPVGLTTTTTVNTYTLPPPPVPASTTTTATKQPTSLSTFFGNRPRPPPPPPPRILVPPVPLASQYIPPFLPPPLPPHVKGLLLLPSRSKNDDDDTVSGASTMETMMSSRPKLVLTSMSRRGGVGNIIASDSNVPRSDDLSHSKQPRATNEGPIAPAAPPRKEWSTDSLRQTVIALWTDPTENLYFCATAGGGVVGWDPRRISHRGGFSPINTGAPVAWDALAEAGLGAGALRVRAALVPSRAIGGGSGGNNNNSIVIVRSDGVVEARNMINGEKTFALPSPSSSSAFITRSDHAEAQGAGFSAERVTVDVNDGSSPAALLGAGLIAVAERRTVSMRGGGGGGGYSPRRRTNRTASALSQPASYVRGSEPPTDEALAAQIRQTTYSAIAIYDITRTSGGGAVAVAHSFDDEIPRALVANLSITGSSVYSTLGCGGVRAWTTHRYIS